MIPKRNARLLGNKRPVYSLEPPKEKSPNAQMKPKAEASMFLHDFARWDDILKSMAESGAEARSGNYFLLRFYYESMWQFWIEIKEIIRRYDSGESDERKINPQLQKLFDSIKSQINDFESSMQVATYYGMAIPMPEQLVSDLRDLHDRLLSTKLKLNLGVWTSTPLSEEQRINRML